MHPTVDPLDPRLDAALRYACALGLLLVTLLPAARAVHPVFGWLPLWLAAMPLAAWWALHGFRLPRRDAGGRPVVSARPRRIRQARRVARAHRIAGAQPRAA
ncbi:MAG TPA: hypothetical protein VEY50_12280 [Lysobacter sp.]|nr:hypothetical protein [Lysobacter sp.]